MKKLLLSFLTAFLFSQATFAQLLPAVNLLAWYPFCNTTQYYKDKTGNGFDLLNTATTRSASHIDPSHTNLGVTFDGTTSDMHYTAPFPMVGNFAYSVWILPVGIQNSVILYNGNPATDGMGIVMNDGTFGGGPGNQVALLFGGLTQQLSTPITLGVWHHLLVLRNGNSYIFFIDNVNAGFYAPAVGGGFNFPTGVFQLGVDNIAGNKHFNGNIDDVAVYDRLLLFTGTNSDVNKIFRFDPDIVFTLGNDTAFCPPSYDLKISTHDYDLPPYSFTWSEAVGTSPATVIASGFSIPSVTVTPSTLTSVYTLTVSGTVLSTGGSTHCEAIDTIAITHVVPNVHLGNDTLFCNGDTLTLNTTPTPLSTFMWSTGETTPSISITSTSTVSVRVDSGAAIYGCVGFDTINIIVAHGASNPLLVDLGPDQIRCQGGTIPMQSIYSYASPKYLWGGPLPVGTSTTVATVATVTGTYWLQVTDSGCVKADTMLSEIVYDTLTLSSPDTMICKGAVVITRATYSSDISYQWTPTTGIPSSAVPVTTIIPDTSAYYVLTARISSCVVRDSFYIDVQPNPTVLLGGNRMVCQYDSLRIIPTILPSWYTNYIYDWSPGDHLDDSTAPNVIFIPGDTTNLILIVTTPAGCTGKDSSLLVFHNGDFASVLPDLSMCPGDSVHLIPTSTEIGTTTYVWHPGREMNDSTSATPWLHPIMSQQYYGIATSTYGCRDTVRFGVTVNPSAVMYLGDSVTVYPGQSYQITPETNCSFFSWSPPAAIDDTSASNPIVTPPVSTTYIVKARTERGCEITDSMIVRVDPGTLLQVPNAFTPGSSSYNNTLKVIMRGVARLRYFRIYNRWGNLVFEGKTLDSGWDGTFNGTPQPMGVYVYEAEAVTDGGKVLRKQGNVTLLR